MRAFGLARRLAFVPRLLRSERNCIVCRQSAGGINGRSSSGFSGKSKLIAGEKGVGGGRPQDLSSVIVDPRQWAELAAAEFGLDDTDTDLSEGSSSTDIEMVFGIESDDSDDSDEYSDSEESDENNSSSGSDLEDYIDAIPIRKQDIEAPLKNTFRTGDFSAADYIDFAADASAAHAHRRPRLRLPTRDWGTDLRSPEMWYAAARERKRDVVAHFGPTNSGKTFSALQRLREADCGVYCAPLRLLAQEVFETLNASGTPCNLVTGQQIVEIEGAQHTACTVEMLDISRHHGVVVVDEVQMTASVDRGWAWTRAILGACCDELHLCGDAAATELVQTLCERTGDHLTIETYKRLSPVVAANSATPLARIGRRASASRVRRKERRKSSNRAIEFNPGDLGKGDVIVAFSRRRLFELRTILRERGFNPCIIYGSLPPESRLEQTARFNDPQDSSDVLLATDAIGMGLNLNIRRVLFANVEKFDGQQVRSLTLSEIKQIGGRAGRFQSEFDSGVVGAMREADLSLIRTAMTSSSEPIKAAGLFPTFEQLSLFSASMDASSHRDAFLDLPLNDDWPALRRSSRSLKHSELLEMFIDAVKTDDLFFLTDPSDLLAIAEAIDDVNLSLAERHTFCMSPVDVKEPLSLAYIRNLAKRYAEVVAGERDKVPTGIRLPHGELRRIGHLDQFETLYKCLDVYLWLNLRYPNEFPAKEEAKRKQERISSSISAGLEPRQKPASEPRRRKSLETKAKHSKTRTRRVARVKSSTF